MPVKIKQCVIDGGSVRSMEDLYGELTRQLPFPPHFGNNLDALWDVLTAEVKGPIRLLWKDAGVSRASMGGNFERVAALLQQAAEERKDFSVTFQE